MPARSTSKSLGLDFRLATPRSAIHPAIAGPNFHHVVMRSFLQHRIGTINGIDQGAGIDLFMRGDAVAIVEEVAAV